MTKKELALEVIRRLKEEYPDAGCTLDYDHRKPYCTLAGMVGNSICYKSDATF